MKRKIYIYQEHISDELILFFEELNNNIKIESIKDDVITLIDTDYYNEEPIDLESYHMLLVEDFDSEVTIFIEPYLEEDFKLGNNIKQFIHALKPAYSVP